MAYLVPAVAVAVAVAAAVGVALLMRRRDLARHKAETPLVRAQRTGSALSAGFQRGRHNRPLRKNRGGKAAWWAAAAGAAGFGVASGCSDGGSSSDCGGGGCSGGGGAGGCGAG